MFPELLLLNEKKAWSSSLLIASRIILKQLADIDALTDAIIAVQKQGSGGIVKGSTGDFKNSILRVLAEGDLVAAHTLLSSSNPSAGGCSRFISSDSKVTKLLSTGTLHNSFLKVLLTVLEHFLKCV